MVCITHLGRICSNHFESGLLKQLACKGRGRKYSKVFIPLTDAFENCVSEITIKTLGNWVSSAIHQQYIDWTWMIFNNFRHCLFLNHSHLNSTVYQPRSKERSNNSSPPFCRLLPAPPNIRKI